MKPIDAALEMIRLGVLAVDDEGRIWKCKEIRNTGAMVDIEPRRAEHPNKNGYLCVVVRHASQQFNVLAHRLVWTVTNGPIPDGQDINHINGNKHSNAPTNLEPVTRSENHRHAYASKLRTANPRGRGQIAPEVRAKARALRADGLSFSQIAKALGISQTSAFKSISPAH